MLEQLRKAREEESGFTLIELLIVIVILGVLAGIVVFAVGGITDRGNESACKSDAKNGSYAADMPALVTAKLLREVPSTTNGYTISYASATGKVTASGACTVT